MPRVVAGKTLLTYSDYVHFPDDGRRHELIEGEHFVTPRIAFDGLAGVAVDLTRVW